MDVQQYRAALATLGLTQKAAGEWLGVSEKTAKRYATTGPSGPAARAIEMALTHGIKKPAGSVGWFIREEDGKWHFTQTRLAAVAALTEGFEVVCARRGQ